MNDVTIKPAELRREAAQALRASREKGRPESEKETDRMVARAYKGLADNAEWLAEQDEKPPSGGPAGS